jgi:hypothetical protein
MDVAEAEDRAADALDAALDWPYSREVWDRVDAERVELLAANEGLAAELAECTEKRERYALQVCLLLDTMKEAGVHINENWCWCGPTIENHSDDGFTVAVITGPQPYQKPEMMGTITEYPTDSASGVQYKPCEICTTQSWCETHGCQCYPTEAMCCVDYPRCDCNSPPEPDNAPAVTGLTQQDYDALVRDAMLWRTRSPTGAGGNARAFVCCEGVGQHAPGCIAQEAARCNCDLPMPVNSVDGDGLAWCITCGFNIGTTP